MRMTPSSEKLDNDVMKLPNNVVKYKGAINVGSLFNVLTPFHNLIDSSMKCMQIINDKSFIMVFQCIICLIKNSYCSWSFEYVTSKPLSTKSVHVSPPLIQLKTLS